MKKNIVDRMIEPFAPQAALRRAKARAHLHAIDVVNRGYSRHGASTRKKSMVGWDSTAGSPDEDITDNLGKLRERSRDLFMGSPLATGALKRIRTNVVGSGLVLNSQIDYGFLGMTPEEAMVWEANTEREFALWSDTQECDASRMMTFGQMQSLVLISALMNGDAFAALPVVKRAGSIYDLRVLLIEADRICNPSIVPQGKDIKQGVEVDKFGAPVKYYIAKKHPGSTSVLIKKDVQPVAVFGNKSGRRNILHIYQDLERIGQRRGAPLLSPVIETLKQLTRYTEAELMASVVAGMFTVFVKTPYPEQPLANSIPVADRVDDEDFNSYEMGNGAIVGLGEGEDVEIANPGRPNTAFDGFVMSLCRWIGVALELPFELLVQHFTSSYSASRAALLEAWKMFRMRRKWLTQQFCQPIYEEWLAEAVAKGRINAPGFFSDPAIRAAWSGAEWYGPSQGQLNPLMEANAAKVRIQEELSTREREAAEITGESWEKIHPKRVLEEDARRRDGTDMGLKKQEAKEGEAQGVSTGGDAT